MVIYFHLRNTIVMSEFYYFEFLKDLYAILTSNMTSNIIKLGVKPVKNGRSMRFYHPWLAARSPSVHWRQIPRCLTSDKAEDKAFMNVKPNHCHVTVAVPMRILAQYNALRICDNSLNPHPMDTKMVSCLSDTISKHCAKFQSKRFSGCREKR